jgi:hypothetical protein
MKHSFKIGNIIRNNYNDTLEVVHEITNYPKGSYVNGILEKNIELVSENLDEKTFEIIYNEPYLHTKFNKKYYNGYIYLNEIRVKLEFDITKSKFTVNDEKKIIKL